MNRLDACCAAVDDLHTPLSALVFRSVRCHVELLVEILQAIHNKLVERDATDDALAVLEVLIQAKGMTVRLAHAESQITALLPADAAKDKDALPDITPLSMAIHAIVSAQQVHQAPSTPEDRLCKFNQLKLLMLIQY